MKKKKRFSIQKDLAEFGNAAVSYVWDTCGLCRSYTAAGYCGNSLCKYRFLHDRYNEMLDKVFDRAAAESAAEEARRAW